MINAKYFLSAFILLILISRVSSECHEGQININTASAEELDSIKWVGEATAKEIIKYRENTEFKSIDDLINVYGIGESKLKDIKEQGLACVEESFPEEHEKSKESINYSIAKKQLQKTAPPEKIILSMNKTKSIKRRRFTERLSSNTLCWLAVFSAIIMFLLAFRLRKNEFR